MYSIYTSTSTVTTITPYSMCVTLSALIFNVTTSTSVSYVIVTTSVITGYTSSGAFCANTGTFWEFLNVFIFLRNADTTIDPPLRASCSHGRV
jgi:hypothetical protein